MYIFLLFAVYVYIFIICCVLRLIYLYGAKTDAFTLFKKFKTPSVSALDVALRRTSSNSRRYATENPLPSVGSV